MQALVWRVDVISRQAGATQNGLGTDVFCSMATTGIEPPSRLKSGGCPQTVSIACAID